MKALILSAGKGTRLLPHTEFVPKCLVQVAGEPILEYQLRALEGLVDEIVVVSGYLHQQVEAFAAPRARIVRNHQYATTNSLHSLSLARAAIVGSEFVLLNGDLVIDRALLAQLIDFPAPTAALVDADVELRDGEMNVAVEDGRIVEFSKAVPADRAHSQSLQITKFGISDAELLFERAAELIAAGESGQFPAFAYDRILASSRMVPVQRAGGMWFEIDNVEDLANCERSLEWAPAPRPAPTAG